jgi:glycosyltransferase involved in cell wall biosynthesis
MAKIKTKTPDIKKNTWVVIPAFNESHYIGGVLQKILQITPNIVVVDDGSKDNTFLVAKKYTPHVIRHAVNLGKGSALKTGSEYVFIYQNAEAVVFIDSDAQHDPQELPLFLQQLEKNDVVLGVRQMNKMPMMRKYGNYLLSGCVKVLFGSFIPDILSGYKGFSKDAYRQVYWYSRRYGVELELAIRISKFKLPFVVVPIRTIYLNFDRGMNILDAIDMVAQIITWRLFV